MPQLLRYLSVVSLAAITVCVSSLDAGTTEAANKQAVKPKVCVSEVYPTSEVLPENLLRFYIYFSRPMQRENVLSSIKLLDSKGEVVSGAFLENKFQLWSPDGTRLTLLFDPGRVKTGLVAHRRLGRALKAGQNYELVIDPTMLAVDGTPLSSTFRRAFRVSKADFEAPDIEKWRLERPTNGSNDSVKLVLNGPQDHVSLAYRIRIKDEAGKTVAGRIELAQAESVWVFKPDQSWTSSGYKIRIDPLLEDVAGNRLTGLFEKPWVDNKRSWSEPRTLVFHPVDSNSAEQHSE